MEQNCGNPEFMKSSINTRSPLIPIVLIEKVENYELISTGCVRRCIRFEVELNNNLSKKEVAESKEVHLRLQLKDRLHDL